MGSSLFINRCVSCAKLRTACSCDVVILHLFSLLCVAAVLLGGGLDLIDWSFIMLSAAANALKYDELDP